MPFGVKVDFDPEEFFKSLGLSGISRIRLGHGVVSRVSYVAAVALIALGIVAYKTGNEQLRSGVAVGIALIFLIYFFTILRFAAKYKEIALLEGAELLAWRQMDISAK